MALSDLEALVVRKLGKALKLAAGFESRWSAGFMAGTFRLALAAPARKPLGASPVAMRSRVDNLELSSATWDHQMATDGS